MRTDFAGSNNHAYLWLNVRKQGFGPQAQLVKDNMKERPINTKEWRFFEITGDVPAEAEWISFGMALVGEGTAWFDSFSLEIVEDLTTSKPQ